MRRENVAQGACVEKWIGGERTKRASRKKKANVTRGAGGEDKRRCARGVELRREEPEQVGTHSRKSKTHARYRLKVAVVLVGKGRSSGGVELCLVLLHEGGVDLYLRGG